MSSAALRSLIVVHRWTSLGSAVFILMLCISGLPLIFAPQIDAALGYYTAPAVPASDVTPVDIDTVVTQAEARYRDARVRYIGRDRGLNGAWFVTLRPSDPKSNWISALYDPQNGRPIGGYPLDGSLTDWLVDLHAALLLGANGRLFIAALGGVILIAVVTGLLIYIPFAPPGGLLKPRVTRAKRLRWLDFHNLSGGALVVWLGLIATSGTILALSGPIRSHWQARIQAELSQPETTKDIEATPITPSAVMTAVRTVSSYDRLEFLAFPGTAYATENGYVAYMQRSSGFAVPIHRAIRVNAYNENDVKTASFDGLTALFTLARPLHFGDFGGLAMRLVWALLDVLAIAVLISGLGAWFQKTAAASLRHRARTRNPKGLNR